MFGEFEKYKSNFKNQDEKNNGRFGEDEKTLRQNIRKIINENSSVAGAKTEAIRYILLNAKVNIAEEDIFADKIEHFDIMKDFLNERIELLKQKDERKTAEKQKLLEDTGCITAGFDFGHIGPDWDFLMQNGISKTIERLKEFKQKNKDKKEFYDRCITVYEAIQSLFYKMAKCGESLKTKNGSFISENLKSLAKNPPKTLVQAMNLSLLMYEILTNLDNTTVRSLGGLDHLYYPFYKSDLESKRFTEKQLRKFTRLFLKKLSEKKAIANMPFYICSADQNGNDMTNPYTKVLIQEYLSLDIYDPKFHVMYHKNIDKDIPEMILKAIRDGKNSFVFINSDTAKNALEKIGISKEDAKRITVYGCYETAAEGCEVAATCGGYVNLAKAVELAMFNGCDVLSKKQIAIKTGEDFESFDEFYGAVKKQIEFMTNAAMDINTAYEKGYDKVFSSPVLSATYKCSVQSGTDLYLGGAKYNNTSIVGAGIATLVDSLAAVRKIVFEEKKVTFSELKEILKSDWKEREDLCNYCLTKLSKYGNDCSEADIYACEITEFFSRLVNGKKNGRGGVFRSGLFSVDMRFGFGKKLCATPNGRKSGEPISKNAAPSDGADKNGVTAYLNSMLKMDFSNFPDGCVADVVLHCSSVEGDDGMQAFFGLLYSFMKRGGFAVHFNVLSPQKLKKAQKEPEKYKNLQIRLCGWNVRFIDLSKEEQDRFILQSENAYN